MLLGSINHVRGGGVVLRGAGKFVKYVAIVIDSIGKFNACFDLQKSD